MPDISSTINIEELFAQLDLSPVAIIAYSIFVVVIGLLMLISYWCIFEKAGEPGWAILIPFYNLYVLFKIVRTNGWKFLLLLIPVANVIILIVMQFQLAKSFGKSGGFGLGLWILPFIFYPILGFGKSTYVGPVK